MASITTDQAKVVVSLAKGEGRRKLQKFLNWSEIDEDSEMRQSVLLDYYYDILVFASNKGFPWNQVCSALQVAAEIQLETQGVTLPEAIRIYRDKVAQYATIFGEANLKMLTEYFFMTYMKHFKLYQFVMTQDREVFSPHTELDIHLCVPPEKLSSATPNHIWEYHQKYKEIEQREGEKMVAVEERLQSKKETIDQLVETSVEEEGPDRQIDREEFIKIMKQVLDKHVSSVTDDLNAIIDDTRDELDIKLDMVSLPRPTELGPPPRFSTKTPLAVNKDKRKDSSRKVSGKTPDKRK